MNKLHLPFVCLLLSLAVILPQTSSAAVSNGTFEAGSLSGWTVANSGSGAWVVYSGSSAPLSGLSISAPPQGTYGAVSDQTFFSGEVMYQDISLAAGMGHTLSFKMYYENEAGDFYTPSPASLDVNVETENQQIRVDILSTSASDFSVAVEDVLLNVYQSQNGNPPFLAPTTVTADLSAFAGTTVRLRFAAVQNVYLMRVGVDDITVTETELECPNISVSPLSLPSGLNGSAYSETISAAGGVSPYQFTVTTGALPSGVTLSTAGILSGTPSSFGSFTFTIRATDDEGCSGEREYTLNINSLPTILSQPESRTNLVGTLATFEVEASGSEPLSFQWLKDGTNLSNGGNVSGAVSSSLELSNVQTADGGDYSLVLVNSFGSVTSSVAVLTVLLDTDADGVPDVEDNCPSVHNPSQTLFTFYRDADSDGYGTAGNTTEACSAPPGYVATAGDCDDSNAAIHPGAVEVIDGVDNDCDTQIDEGIAPSITALAAGVTNSAGAAISITVSATGSSPLAFQWRRDGTNVVDGGRISGAGSATLSIDPLNVLDDGEYDVIVSNSVGTNNGSTYVSVECPSLTLTASTVPDAIVGTSYSHTVQGSGGTAPYTFVTGSPLPVGLTLGSGGLLSGVPTAEVLGYVISMELTDANGCSANVNVTINVNSAPAFAVEPSSTAVGLGTNVILSATVTGTAPLTYRWSKDFVDVENDGRISGATSSALTIAGASVGDAGAYRLSVTNAAGSAVSSTANLSVVAAPIISAPPSSATVNQGAAVTFFVTAAGDDLSYQWWHSGSEIPGATGSAYTDNNVQPGDEGTYKAVVSNLAGSFESASATLVILLDDRKPGIRIVSPRLNGIYTNANLVGGLLAITGGASDNVGVNSIEYNLNSAGFVAPTVTGSGKLVSWNANVGLAPGTNIIVFRATDLAGNVHQVSRRFFYHVSSPLTIHIIGNGSITNRISSNWYYLNNTNLFVGRNYKLTAIQNYTTGYILTNWTDVPIESATATNVLQTNHLILNFTMRSNMHIYVNFVTNAFHIKQGHYNGLFYEADGVKHHSAGFFSMKLTLKGSYSAKVSVDGNNVGTSGKFKIEGTSVTLAKRQVRLAKTDLVLNLALDMTGNSDQVTGTLSDTNGVGWSSDITADHQVWTTSNQATQYTNIYSVVIPGGAAAQAIGAPVGDSFLVSSVLTNGVAKVLAGGLSDSPKLPKVIKAFVSKNGEWPVFAPLYATPTRETRGEILGWLTLQPNTNTVAMNMAPLGKLQWTKPAMEGTAYTNGFTNVIEVIASRYILPVEDSGIRAFNMETGIVSLAEGELSTAIPAEVALTPENRFLNLKPINNGFKPTFTAKKALIGGPFLHPLNTLSSTKVLGTVLQDQNEVTGYFVSPNGISGTLSLDVTVPAP